MVSNLRYPLKKHSILKNESNLEKLEVPCKIN